MNVRRVVGAQVVEGEVKVTRSPMLRMPLPSRSEVRAMVLSRLRSDFG